MAPTVSAFWEQKLGSNPDECEDSVDYCLTQGRHYCIRAAIADGATGSSFSREWAHLLVSCFLKHGERSPLRKNLESCIQSSTVKWQTQVDSLALPWYAEEKARKGAFASFLGVDVKVRRLQKLSKWRAVAIGDSCLFHIRDNSLLISFPLERSCQFNNSPCLLSSKPESNKEAWETVKLAGGLLKHGDQLIIATDALSEWMLRQREAGIESWDFITSLNQDDFQLWASERRRHGSMKNDDVSYLLINNA